MSRAQAERVIETILIELTQMCLTGPLSGDSVDSMVEMCVVQDTRDMYHVDQTLTNYDMQIFKEICTARRTTASSPSLDTIKMQVYFDMNYSSRREFLKEINWKLESRLHQVSRDITDSRVKTKEQLDVLYRKIITYILLGSGMGSPSDVNSVQEATVPAVLCEALSVTKEAIKKELTVSQDLAWKYTALLEKYTDSLPGDCDVSLVQLTQMLYNVRQHELFLQILLADAGLSANRIEILQKDICSQINLLKNSVQPKTAVPTTKVFPLFKALSKLWSELQDEAELLNIFSNILLRLQSFLTSEVKIFSKTSLDSLLEGLEVKTDGQRINESSCERIDQVQMKQNQWFLFETTDSLTGLSLQYNGYCGYTLAQKNGILLPGNPYIGILKHKEKMYVFSSKEAAVKFVRSPDHFIALVTERAKASPELIKLLQLHQNPTYKKQGETVLTNLKCEDFTQTDVHPMEANIVKSYEWNEWELRRKAIKLADLRTTVTHSTQTHLSHMRRENDTQTWLPKEVGCQTKRDGSTCVPKPQIFLAGLRGQRGGCMEKVDLTRSINEE
ncbi:cilia- and flagella-associated protein 206 isoform X2 [Nerophis lumbriciformis]|uniref:cilia- and flagella-associated protein 206 isoform X2 n=1 Tax=Nerophis lumbriciformis TaxID=546530 RepID=UPI002ADF464D|nr:cilia- and flagella-associated protein 206-like isoform X2 [Nerophis lumbriciformis]